MAFARPRPAAPLGRDGKRHAYAIDLNNDAARIKAQAARTRLATSLVAAAIGAAEVAHANAVAEERKHALAELRARSPRLARRARSRPSDPHSESDAEEVDAMATPRVAPASKAAATVMRSYDGTLQHVRGKYGAAKTSSSTKTPPPRLAPLPGSDSNRRARGGAIGRAPRRTVIDDTVAPLASSALTPTPGPAMLPYLELFDPASPETRPQLAGGPTQRPAAGHPAAGSQWHRSVGRNVTRRTDVGCRPVYLPPIEKHVRGGAIGTAERRLF